MQFYKHTETGNIFIITRQPSLQPNVREYIELETNNHHLITSDLLEPVTFQKAFYDEIESIVRQYKDALHQCQSSHTQVRIELEQVKTAKEMESIKYKDTIMNLESDLDYQKKIHEKDIDNLNKAHEANSKLSIRCNELEKAFKESQSESLKARFDLEEIEKLKLERDQLVIDYNELENKKFDSDLVQVSIGIEGSLDNENWYNLFADTITDIQNDVQYEIYKSNIIKEKFIRVKLINKSIDYEAISNDTMTNNEYALKTRNDSLKLALDKLSDLAVKFYLKSEGVIL